MGNLPESSNHNDLVQKSRRLETLPSFGNMNCNVVICTSGTNYRDWRNSLQIFLDRISCKSLLPRMKLEDYFWLPISQTYRSNNLDNKGNGQAILTFPLGFSSLSKLISQAHAKNQPFMIQSLWNLLFTLTNLASIIRNNAQQIKMCTDSILGDYQLNQIKICTPMTSFCWDGSNFRRYPSQMIDNCINGSIEGSQKSPKVDKNLIVGIILSECILLESSSHFQNGNVSKNYQEFYQEKIRNVLRVPYYPLKLRIIVAGMMQIDQRIRFTALEVQQLLKCHQPAIKSFQPFHQRKTDFVNIFGKKLQALKIYMPKLTQISSANKQTLEAQYQNLQNKEQRKRKRPTPLILSLNQANKSERYHQMPSFEQGSPTRTLNLSISSLPKLAKKDDISSLNYSKSDYRSPRSNTSEFIACRDSFILEQNSSAEGSKYELPFESIKQEHLFRQNKASDTDFQLERILVPVKEQRLQLTNFCDQQEKTHKNRNLFLGIVRIKQLQMHQLYQKQPIQPIDKTSESNSEPYFTLIQNKYQSSSQKLLVEGLRDQKQEGAGELYQESSMKSFGSNVNKTKSLIDRLDPFNTSKEIDKWVDLDYSFQSSPSKKKLFEPEHLQGHPSKRRDNCQFKQLMLDKMKRIEDAIAKSQWQFPSE